MSRLFACALVLAVHTHALAQVPAVVHPLSMDAYVAELDRLAAFVGTSTPTAAEKISGGLAPRWIVDVGGERVTVDARWLVDGLRGASQPGTDWNTGRERLRRRLLALRAHAAEVAGTAAPGPQHASFRTAVADVLARPEFRASTGASWRERLQQRVGAWIASLLGSLGFRGVSGRSVAVAFAWIAAIAALGGLGIWLARTLAAGSRAVSFELAPAGRQPISARAWALRARTARRDGNAREAIRCAYNAALRRMEEDGAWRLERSRTPREYLRMVEPDDHRRPAMKDLTDLFEQVWYGNHTIDDAAMHRVSASLERLECLQPSDRAI